MADGEAGLVSGRIESWRRWAMAGLLGVFALGLLWDPVGAWTGHALGAWFMGTQPPMTGWLVLVITGLPGLGPSAPWTGLGRILLGTLPFLLYRFLTGRRADSISACCLPCWGAACWGLATHLGWGGPYLRPWLSVATFAIGGQWAWVASGAPGSRRWPMGLAFLSGTVGLAWILAFLGDGWLAWGGLAGGVFLGLRAIRVPSAKTRRLSVIQEHLPWLREPGGGQALAQEGSVALATASGARFRIQRGLPVFQESARITGPDRIYHRIYQGIGGFYDDIQRVYAALKGTTLQRKIGDYMQFLEVPQGAAVLETSVGTGLNLAGLPEDARIFGLDLSMAMLERCARNLDNWGRKAVLVQGNAEALPFPDEAFDAVFHVGGINFFSDRAAAIREMIRVAKPGSRLLIADETEAHVQSAYDRSPLVGRLFQRRTAPVAPPVELVPPEMEEIQLRLLRGGRFYALTFRKP